MPDNRVLIVGVDQSLLVRLENNLVTEGYKVVIAAGSTLALDAARASKPDLIILDITPPGMAGPELYRTLRQETAAPILMFAGDDEIGGIIDSDSGTDGYLTKPFTMAELLSRVRAMLRMGRDIGSSHTANRLGVAPDRGKLPDSFIDSRENGHHCASCGAEITGDGVIVKGKPYCSGCAGNGPQASLPVIKGPDVIASPYRTDGTTPSATMAHLTDLLDSIVHILKDWQRIGLEPDEEQVLSNAIKQTATELNKVRSGVARGVIPGKAASEADSAGRREPESHTDTGKRPLYELGVDVFFNGRHYITGSGGIKGPVHSHSWRAQVKLRGHAVTSDGILMGFADAKNIVQREVEKFNGVILNDIPLFGKTQPTTENIAAALYHALRDGLQLLPLKLTSVCVWESPTSYIMYTGSNDDEKEPGNITKISHTP